MRKSLEMKSYLCNKVSVRESAGLNLQKIEAISVVRVGDLLPLDTLHTIEFLLLLERVNDEVLLQLLVRKVDAELLERIRLKRLKPVDVEDADKAHR